MSTEINDLLGAVASTQPALITRRSRFRRCRYRRTPLRWGAIEIAREQGARWWELRAHVSLARLLQHGGRRTAARDLQRVVSAITEGHDTADMRAARALRVASA